MKTITLAANETSSGAKTTFNVNPQEGHRTGVFTVEISATATVKLQGRMNSNFAWTDINTYTATTAENVTLFPEMRVNVTAYTSGSVDAVLGV